MNEESAHVVSIQIQHTIGKKIYSQYAAGSIIRKDFVLTTASALYGQKRSKIKVVSIIPRQSKDKPQESLGSIIIHPNYDPATNDKDIALLRLSTPFRFEAGSMKDIKLAGETGRIGTVYTVFGWGVVEDSEMEKESGGRQFSEKINTFLVTSCGLDKCSIPYAGLVTKDMICASAKSIGPCFGDGGGSLVFKEENGTPVLHGLTSWGRAHNCTETESSPSVYTNVIPFTSWIKEIIHDGSATYPKVTGTHYGWVTNEKEGPKIFTMVDNTIRYSSLHAGPDSGPGPKSGPKSGPVPERSLTFHTAMWIEENPINPIEGVKSGDHFWNVHFGQLENVSAWVGISSIDRLKSGWASSGLFYGRNLSDGNTLIAANYGPSIKSENVIGILVSFPEEQTIYGSRKSLNPQIRNVGQKSDRKLRIYFFWNFQPLGLAFTVPVTEFPKGVYPVVAFNANANSNSNANGSANGTAGTGVARIQKEKDIPQNFISVDNPRKGVPLHTISVADRAMLAIEGLWKTSRGSIKIQGKAIDCRITLKILKQGEGHLEDRWRTKTHECTAILRIINTQVFKVRAVDKRTERWRWERMNGPPTTTFLGSTSEMLNLEREVSALVQNPEGVIMGKMIHGKNRQKVNTMTITNGEPDSDSDSSSSIQFIRYEHGPRKKALCINNEWCDPDLFDFDF